MVLVADRIGLNTGAITEMKQSIVKAISDYVDVYSEEEVEVNLSTDPDLGTIYSVAVPIKRVKQNAVIPYGDEEGGILVEYDESNPESDPSSQFPYGC